MKIILLSIISAFIVSCSPINRHAKLVKKFPYVHTQDSVKLIDTFRIKVPQISVDSIFKIDSFLLKLNDTIFITKDRLKIKMYSAHDSILIEGICDTIFLEKIIIRNIPIRYYKEFDPNSWKGWIKIIFGISIFLILLIILYKIIRLFI